MNRFLKNLTLVLSFIAVGVVFVLYLAQKRIVNNLQVQQVQLSEDLKRGTEAQRFAEGFKKKGLPDTKTQESFIMARIPLEEKEPVSLLKLLTRVATEAEVNRISITSKPRQQRQVAFGENLYHFPLVLELECGYQELCAFLNKILSMDRLVLIQELSIERKEELLPQLKVTLTLFAYTVSYTNHQPEGDKLPAVPPKPKLRPEPEPNFL